MAKILAVDPGSFRSGCIAYDTDTESILNILRDTDGKSMMLNEELVYYIKNRGLYALYDAVVIEDIQCYGSPMGKSTIATCKWIGRFWQAADTLGIPTHFIFRKDIRKHHTGKGSGKGGDAKIRAALIKRFGEPGTKKNPGKLFGITHDNWSSTAIAVYFGDMKGQI